MTNRTILTIHPFDPCGGKIGGIENFIRAMLRHTPAGVRHVLVGVTESPCERPLRRWQTLVYEGQEIDFYPLLTDADPNRRSVIPLFLRYPLRLRGLDLPFKPDLCIAHRVEPLAALPVRCEKTIHFFHGDPREITGKSSEVKWKHAPRLYRMLERKAVDKAHQLRCVNRVGCEYLQESYPQKDVCFQPTGYREDIFFSLPEPERLERRAKTLEPYALDPNNRHVLFAARFEEQKNPLLAVQTFAELNKQLPDVHLVLAGQGSLKQQSLRLCDELKITGSVHDVGALKPDDLAEIMRASDLFFMTSRFEGMPIAALEALACGLPIVSTNAGEIASIIQPNKAGMIAEPPTAQSLCDGAIHVLSNPNQFTRDYCAASVTQYRSDSVMYRFYQDFLR